ncbi:erythrocyte membrane protein 1, EMP1 [Plasmodium reichenowi]|uniref:Erythrocyte membrane protein 1, EMP1 n=1 Tax=Plasmodium reichenowi TaxID=5854 RepID=A0A060RQR7_PLARE|nr:erythrocyte membrane protein 1, EMP1 [Plasmodium reichenowi]
MAPGTGVLKDGSVKHLFDRIGKIVHDKAKGDAQKYNSQLQGHLSLATYKGEKSNVTSACDLDHRYETNVTDGHSDPCEGRQSVRFSNEYGGQCTDTKIRGNDNNNNGGACAPLRRLFLCDQNLEHIKPDKITNTHNLLVDVLLAAKYEGQSIQKEYTQKGGDYKSGLCTALARSFADIGDIIRGKDLFIGYNEKDKTQKDKLQQNLKQYFEKIHEGLIDPRAKVYYNDTEKNFYQLRSDWWNANRNEVWKAIICGAPDNAEYFEKSDGGQYHTYTHCRYAGGDVLTNFDYVPQYLRWFEEWAEEFCRKKKKKVEILEQQCRGVNYNGEPKYCSLNGYDCEKTIYKKGELVMGNGCNNCLVACSHYKRWLANQKQEFLKQKKKCVKEIYGNIPQNGLSGNINNDYDKKFYDELKKKYNDINDFLNLLNNEKECKNSIDQGGKIDFNNTDDDSNNNDINKGTFYRSEYCQVCPECGVEKQSSGEFRKRDKSEDECKGEEDYRTPPNADITRINVLYSGDEGHDIIKKLRHFCNTNGKDVSKEEKWECYYAQSHDSKCRMENGVPTEKDHPNIMTYISFFMFWVNNMLKDSIDWREKINICINEGMGFRV